ncbi:MAG: putative hydrolases or acyltransferases (alpha/beta hydrolase superfamily) [Idiomarinaceae bacterium HL-53]|nr:MAG: putative hydrolases or acyltransferases (alpha/beta hydrolase superfamily) [Idiomarinaceae bacterium HL-53]
MSKRILPRSVVRSSVENVYGDPSKVTPELVDRYYELTLRAGNRGAVAKRFEQMDGPEFEYQIQNVMQPTLILWGQKDRLIPVTNAQRFHQDILGSELVVFDSLGHVPHEESPQLKANVVSKNTNDRTGCNTERTAHGKCQPLFIVFFHLC